MYSEQLEQYINHYCFCEQKYCPANAERTGGSSFRVHDLLRTRSRIVSKDNLYEVGHLALNTNELTRRRTGCWSNVRDMRDRQFEVPVRLGEYYWDMVSFEYTVIQRVTCFKGEIGESKDHPV